MSDYGRVRSQAALADELTRPSADPTNIVYLSVIQRVVGVSVTVDYDGASVVIAQDRCYGCGGTQPAIGETVAVHVNGTELVVIGRHL